MGHLDVLRAAIIRVVAVTVIFGVLTFFLKEQLFAVVLAPKDSGFITYRFFNAINGMVTDSYVSDFSIKFINTGLAEQFIIHMKTAMYAGVLCASPIFFINYSDSFPLSENISCNRRAV